MYINEVYAHTIYPARIRIAKWKVPKGLRTLKEFLAFYKFKGLSIRRIDHPIAFELYAKFSTRKVFPDELLREFIVELIKVLLSSHDIRVMFSPELFEYMDYGITRKRTLKAEPPEAYIRYSRDGIYFKEIDITHYLRYVLKMLDTKYKLGVVE